MVALLLMDVDVTLEVIVSVLDVHVVLLLVLTETLEVSVLLSSVVLEVVKLKVVVEVVSVAITVSAVPVASAAHQQSRYCPPAAVREGALHVTMEAEPENAAASPEPAKRGIVPSVPQVSRARRRLPSER
jgi:hypothetical protein